MDWRNRKYYAVRFSYTEFDYRMGILKSIGGVRIHPPTKLTSANMHKKFHDELEPRGYYQYVISCNTDDSEVIEFELRKSQRQDALHNTWKEIKQSNKEC